MNLAVLPIFPCNTAKEPLVERGFKSARLNVKHSGWPLIGFPTGGASGIDVLDVDPNGVGWFDANFDGLPQTRAHQTQRGLHLLFRHADGLRCSTSKIAAGIDIRADGGYAIWWPREGLPIEDHPICEWPEWLLKEAMEACGRREGYLSNSLSLGPVVTRPGLREAFLQLDPRCWNGEHDAWLRLLMACKAAGITRAEFVEWSTQDPDYAHDARIIETKWNSAPARHYGALVAALKEAGIKVKASHTPHHRSSNHAEVRFSAVNWRSRFEGIRKWLKRHASEDGLFSASCLVAEIIEDRPTARVKELLLQDCTAYGLTAVIDCSKTIERAFEYITNKQQEN
jgi:Bifunctional DNA primase/polymerase, N-terminal/Primase C terminal 2 (PriCT-2)